MSLASYEIDMQGARHFIDFALSSPYIDSPTIVFVSSIGVVMSAQYSLCICGLCAELKHNLAQ